MKAKKNNTILVAEDDPGISELMRAILETEGYPIVICSNGNEVAAKATSLMPAVIFMDLWLPGMDGVKLSQKLKSDKATKHIPIIIISAQNKLADVVKNVKADGYLPKPFELSDLLALAAKYSKLNI